MKTPILVLLTLLASACWADTLPVGGVFSVGCRDACGQDAVDIDGATVCTERLGLVAYVANGIQLDLDGTSVTIDHADGPETLPITNIQAYLYTFPFPTPLRIKPGEKGAFPITITPHPGDDVLAGLPLHFEVHGVELYANQPSEPFTFILDHFLTIFPAGSCPVTTTTSSVPPAGTTTTTTVPTLGGHLGVCVRNGVPKKCD